uniref:Phospholipid phosphatase related 5b n=1 Tax=Sinocyclocheilus grahami TaxID=75366 RepID=A0A672SEE7_SINGR
MISIYLTKLFNPIDEVCSLKRPVVKARLRSTTILAERTLIWIYGIEIVPILIMSISTIKHNTFIMTVICRETVLFLIQYTSKDLDSREKTIMTGDCCYLNPLVRRNFRFLGVYMFGLFTTDIFVNAGQVVTGNLAPHFLTLCKPNYTALGCQQALRYISHQEACTGNEDDILRARKTFPSKEAALSVYAAVYMAMYITFTVKAKGTRLAKPVMSLGLMCLAFLTGINRVAEYRNHWSDVIAGFIIGVAIATFLVSFSSVSCCIFLLDFLQTYNVTI